ncbi:hypothetical protein GYMLUDRAFT_92174 [Collybiopsis luxurians FD-317 M1]|nr:hypothetical protein GYMLUDRAFT_92174 [Collybiopsis luxurians FD-317 M1]
MPRRYLNNECSGKSLDAEDLPTKLANIFAQVQSSVANHHKNLINLHRIFVEVAQADDALSDKFQEIFYLLFMKLLASKKTTESDRVAKFMADFLNYLHDKAEDEFENSSDDSDFESKTPAENFTENLVHDLLLRGASSKQKNVRYRSVELSARIAQRLPQINKDLYYLLRGILVDRIQDSLWPIREKAAVALCTFYRVDDPEEPKPHPQPDSLAPILLQSLANDSKEEVRAAILCNLPLNMNTLVGIIDRTRDIVSRIRREAYDILKKNITVGEIKDEDLDKGLTHPRNLQLSQRDLIVRNALGDRDDSVRASASELLVKWVEAISLGTSVSNDGKDCESSLKDAKLERLLSLFDLRSNEQVPGAIMAIFEKDTKIPQSLSLVSDWRLLSPGMALITRVFTEYCAQRNSLSSMLDNKALPELTAIAYCLQGLFNELVKATNEYEKMALFLDDEARALRQDEIENREFVIAEIFKTAMYLGSGDENGCREMKKLISAILTHACLPETLIAPCVALLCRIESTEQEVVRTIDDLVHRYCCKQPDVDGLTSDLESLAVNSSSSSTKGKSPEFFLGQRERRDAKLMRCLSIYEVMLQLIDVKFQRISPEIRSIYDLALTAANRKTNDVIREKGFLCLALVGLTWGPLARKALIFFIKQMEPNFLPTALKMAALQAIFDILLWYEMRIMDGKDLDPSALIKTLTSLLKMADHVLDGDMRALLCEGLAKLVYNNVLVDHDITVLLVEHYFSAEYAQYHQLKQCLSFFLNKYCASTQANQERIAMTFVPTFRKLCAEQDSMHSNVGTVSLEQFADIMVTWTDPKFLRNNADLDLSEDLEDTYTHLNLVFEIIKELMLKGDCKVSKEQKKTLFKLLKQLYLPEKVDEHDVRHLSLLINKVSSSVSFPDSHAKKAFLKFQNNVTDKYKKQLEAFSEEDFRALEKYQDDIAFLDSLFRDGTLAESARSRKRRLPSEDIVSAGSPHRSSKRVRVLSSSVHSFDSENSEPLQMPPSINPGKARQTANPLTDVDHDLAATLDEGSSGEEEEMRDL